MSKILSVIGILLGILIGLKYYGVYDGGNLISFDLTLIGALYLLASQLFYYAAMHFTNRGTTASAKVIRLVLIMPGVLYAVKYFFAINLAFDMSIIIALILFLEGIYGLH